MSLDDTLEQILRKSHVDGYMTAINTLRELAAIGTVVYAGVVADFLENFGPELFGSELWKEGNEIRIEARRMSR